MPTYYPSDIKYNPVPFDHTYVLYDPTDMVSLISVHLSLLPIYTMVFYTSWFLLSREIEPVIVVGGHLCGEILNKIIKRLIKQPRPDFHKDFGSGSYSLTYGMPLAHSQFMGFFAAYFICILLFKMSHFSLAQKHAGCAILVVLSGLVAFSRVYLLYHTPQQVLVGVMFGAALGLVYFIVIAVARDVGFIDWILNWPVVRYFYIKDSYFHCFQTYKEEFALYVEMTKLRKAAAAGGIIGNFTEKL